MSSVIDYIVSPQKASMDSGQHKQRPIVSLNRKKILSSRHEPHRHIPAKIPPSRHGGGTGTSSMGRRLIMRCLEKVV